MAVYLRTVPAKQSETAAQIQPNPPAVAASTLYSPPASRPGDDAGLRLFEGACASCHGWNGEGVQTAYGSLRGAQTVNDPDAINLIQVILRGSAIETAEGRLLMPPFGASMTDTEVAALSNYVLRHFGNKRGTVTPARVAEARKLAH
jgi:mono/diheme cytochrome c family protein